MYANWLKANSGKKRPSVEEVKDRDNMGVRVSPLGKHHRLYLGSYPKMFLKEASLAVE